MCSSDLKNKASLISDEVGRLIIAASAVDLEIVASETRLKDLDERQRELDAWRSEVISRRAFWAAERRDCIALVNKAAEGFDLRVAEGLAKKLEDPRFAEAEATLTRVRAREAEIAKDAPPLTPEAVEGLKLLRRGFNPEAIKRPSRRVVHDYAEGGSGAVYDETDDGPEEPEDTSIPCPDCGALVGVACDESKPHRDDEETEEQFRARVEGK